MLMDMFFAGAPVAKKRRVHFNAFMLEVHQSLHRWRREASGDPIPPLARSIAEEVRLLCFDEFQVEDIADAMLLGRLFEALFEDGLVVVATSNYAPDDLYKDGLQRENFLPFIALIKERLDILELDGGKDYRRRRLQGLDVYHTPLGVQATAALDAAFARLTDSAVPVPTVLAFQGRRLELARTAKGVAYASFDELCRAPLGPADFLAIARHFHTLILDGVPRALGRPAQRGAAFHHADRRALRASLPSRHRRRRSARPALSRGRWRFRFPPRGLAADRDAVCRIPGRGAPRVNREISCLWLLALGEQKAY